MLSPALFKLKNIKWLFFLLFLLLLNMLVLWLWVNFLTLRYQRYLMYLGYLPVDSRSRVPLPLIRPPFKDNENGQSDAEGGNMVESFYIKSKDGTMLHAHFYKFPSSSRYSVAKNKKYKSESVNIRSPTVLFFHGTSGNIGHKVDYAYTLSSLCQCNVMLMNCRGYGLSDGYAHIKGIREDSQAGLEYLIERKDVDGKNIFVLGQSMGGAITIDLVMRNLGRIKGMIVDNTFTRIKELVPEVLPPFSHLRDYLTEDWDSLGAIQGKEGDQNFPHCLFLLGDQDELINPKNGRELFKAAVQSAKESKKEVRLLLFKYGYHVFTFRDPFYFDSISQFINEVCTK